LGVRAWTLLKRHALHSVTDKRIPDELITKLEESRRFNQGFETVEYTACALLDMALHALARTLTGVDISEFERAWNWRASACRARSCCFHPPSPFRPSVPGKRIRRQATTSTYGRKSSTATAMKRSSEADNPIEAPGTATACGRFVYSSGGRTLDPAAAYRVHPMVRLSLGGRVRRDERRSCAGMLAD
jgi:peptidyl-dipeptidase Dcp